MYIYSAFVLTENTNSKYMMHPHRRPLCILQQGFSAFPYKMKFSNIKTELHIFFNGEVYFFFLFSCNKTFDISIIQLQNIWLPGKGHMLHRQLDSQYYFCPFANLVILYENSIFLTGMRTKSDRRQKQTDKSLGKYFTIQFTSQL